MANIEASTGPVRVQFRSERRIEGILYRVIARTQREVDAVWDAIEEDLEPSLISTPLMRKAGEPELSRLELHRMMTHGEVYTYFARGKWSGRIKIGRSNEPWRRARELIHSRNGEDAELEATLRGSHFEKHYHHVFAAHAHGNEWFLPHQDILDEIDRLKVLSVPDYAIVSAHFQCGEGERRG